MPCLSSSGWKDQLVTVEQQHGVEYVVGFVAARFPCNGRDSSSLVSIFSVLDMQLGEYLYLFSCVSRPLTIGVLSSGLFADTNHSHAAL